LILCILLHKILAYYFIASFFFLALCLVTCIYNNHTCYLKSVFEIYEDFVIPLFHLKNMQNMTPGTLALKLTNDLVLSDIRKKGRTRITYTHGTWTNLPTNSQRFTKNFFKQQHFANE